MPTGFLIGTFFTSLVGIFGIYGSEVYLMKKEERARIKKALKKDAVEETEATQAQVATQEMSDETATAEEAIMKTGVQQTMDDSLAPPPEKTVEVPEKKKMSAEQLKEIKQIINQAEVHLARKEFQDAEKLFIKILALEPDHTPAIQKLAYLYIQIESYPKAETLYKQLAEEISSNPGIHTNLGLALFNQKKFEESIDAYKQAIGLEPDRAARYANLGQVYFVIKDLESAIGCFQEAVKRESRNIDHLYLLADAYQEAKQFSQARKWYEKILDLSPYDEAAKEEVRRLKALGF